MAFDEVIPTPSMQKLADFINMQKSQIALRSSRFDSMPLKEEALVDNINSPRRE
jgi:hypothetical protein